MIKPEFLPMTVLLTYLDHGVGVLAEIDGVSEPASLELHSPK